MTLTLIEQDIQASFSQTWVKQAQERDMLQELREADQELEYQAYRLNKQGFVEYPGKVY